MSQYIVSSSTPYQGGYFKFSWPFLRDVPIIEPSAKEGNAAQSRLNKLWAQRQAANDTTRSAIDRRIDEVVFELYGVKEAELEEAIIPVAIEEDLDHELLPG